MKLQIAHTGELIKEEQKQCEIEEAEAKMLKQSKSKDFFSRLHEQRYGIVSRQLLKDVQDERKRQTQQEHSIRLESTFEPPPLPKHTAKDFYKLIRQLNTRTYEDLIAEERA